MRSANSTPPFVRPVGVRDDTMAPIPLQRDGLAQTIRRIQNVRRAFQRKLLCEMCPESFARFQRGLVRSPPHPGAAP